MQRLKEEAPTRDEVLIGLDSPDDAAVVSTPPGTVNVHTVDFFRKFVDDPFVFGQVYFFSCVQMSSSGEHRLVNCSLTRCVSVLFFQIAANHALSDCHAMGAQPISALALAVVPFSVEDKMEDALYQMMAGACVALKEANCALVGGHSRFAHAC